jgi:ribosome-binding protein aMBF1 (putative translation factor)
VVERGVLFLSARSLPPDRDPDKLTKEKDMEVVELTEPLDAREALNRLVEIRKASGLRQVDVAARMDIGQPSVSELERGEVVPKIVTLERYAEAVGVKLKVVLVGGETVGPATAEHGV